MISAVLTMSNTSTIRPTVPILAIGHLDPVCQASRRQRVRVRGANVTIFEFRPPWCPEVGPDWGRRSIAQLRHTRAGFWLVLWQNRSDRRERYRLAPDPTRDLDALLAELGQDEIRLFWR